jgi:CheY-like chemotaxis protein
MASGRSSASAGVLMNVVTDCGMEPVLAENVPEMGGYEATRAIRGLERERGRGHRTPIIAMTAHALRQDQQRCLDEGMDDYIGKPISIARLSEVLGARYEIDIRH